MEPTEDPPLVAKLRSLLNRSTRIEITDGRLFVGQFMCIDRSKNIILAGAYESRPTKLVPESASASGSESTSTQDNKATPTTTPTAATTSSVGETAASKPGILKRKEDEGRRFVGQIMIPGHHIVKVEVDCSHLRGADSRLKAPVKYGMDYFRG